MARNEEVSCRARRNCGFVWSLMHRPAIHHCPAVVKDTAHIMFRALVFDVKPTARHEQVERWMMLALPFKRSPCSFTVKYPLFKLCALAMQSKHDMHLGVW